MNELLALPREWLAATAEIAGFMGTVVRDVWGLRVLRFFGEALRQAGILIVGSTLVIWGLVFVTGLGTCGIEGAYFLESQGAPSYAGVFTALCDRGDADQRGDRRPGGDGVRLDDVPVRNTTACLLDRVAVHVHRSDRRRLPGLLYRRGVADWIHVCRGLSIALLGVPESTGPAV